MKITKMDRTSLGMIRKELAAAVKEIEKKLSIKIEVGKCRYDDVNATFALEVAVVQGGVAQTQEVVNWDTFARLFDLDRRWLGKTITVHKHQYTILGLNPRRREFPVVCRREDNRTFFLPADVVRKALNR